MGQLTNSTHAQFGRYFGYAAFKQFLLGGCGIAVMALAGTATAQTQPNPAPPPNQPVKPTSDAGQTPQTQGTDANAAAKVGEVIVTAKGNRGLTLQHVPAAITAFSDERRNVLGIEDPLDIAKFTPSASLQGEFLSLRGVGRQESAQPGLGVDPGVVSSIDGLYASSPATLDSPDFLTDRIEVLPGPQIVFGHSSLGGTVDVISKRPTNDLHADLRAGINSLDIGYLQADVSGPINDQFRYRLAYEYSDQFEPLQKNAPGFPDTNQRHEQTAEAQLEWTPTSHLDIWVRYQNYFNNQTTPYGIQNGNYAGTALAGPYDTTSPSVYGGLVVNPALGLPANSNPQSTNPKNVAVAYPGNIRLDDTHTVVGNIIYDFNNGAQIKYIGGYSQYSYNNTYQDPSDLNTSLTATNVYGTQIPGLYVDAVLQQKQWGSNELQLISSHDQPLQWVAGFYQYVEHYYNTFAAEDPLAAYFANPVGGPPNPNREFYGYSADYHEHNEAIYGQLQYDLTSTVKLTGALRYDWYHKTGSDSFREIYDLNGFFAPYVPVEALDVTPADHAASAAGDWHDWTGKVEIQWQPDPTLLTYAQISKGYKPGGFSLGALTPIPVAEGERLIDYEAGFKKTWGTLLFNAAVYYYDYSDQQVPLSILPASGIPQLTIVNAQKSRSYGLELQSVWSPTHDLHVSLIYSYLNAEFTNFRNPTGQPIVDLSSNISYANLDGNTAPQSPKNKVTVSPQYIFHLPGSQLSVSANYSWTASEYYGIFNTPAYRGPSYYNLDLRAVWQPEHSPITFIAYARNVTDTRQTIFRYPSGANPLQSLYAINTPVSVGGELQFHW